MSVFCRLLGSECASGELALRAEQALDGLLGQMRLPVYESVICFRAAPLAVSSGSKDQGLQVPRPKD